MTAAAIEPDLLLSALAFALLVGLSGALPLAGLLWLIWRLS